MNGIVILLTVFSLVAIKAIIVGSEFSFWLWFQHGREYTHWYNNRPTFPKSTPDHW